MVTAGSHTLRPGQSAHVHDYVGLEVPSGVRHPVREHQAALGVGVVNLKVRIAMSFISPVATLFVNIICQNSTLSGGHLDTAVPCNYFWELRSVVRSSPGRGIFAIL